MSSQIEVKSPYDSQVISTKVYESFDDTNHKLETMFNFWSNPANWTAKYERIERLEKFLELFSTKKDELIETAVLEGAKPYKDTVVEFERAVTGVKLAIAEIYKYDNQKLPMGMNEKSSEHLAYLEANPIGPVLAICAFNHPINLVIHQVIPAVAIGTPVLIKPASKTPLSCVKIVELLHEAGFSKSECDYTLCKRQTVTALLKDPRIKFLSFIGGESVGWSLADQLHPQAKYALEHGGIAPLIVDDKFDLTQIIPKIIKAAFYHAGQVCVSLQRLLIKEELLDYYLADLKEHTSKLKTGNPMSKDTEVGPIIDESSKTNIKELIQDALDNGATLVTGGKELENNIIEPTILLNPNNKAKINFEEVFGPVLVINTYRDFDEAIDKANSLKYVFQSAIYTKDIVNSFEAAKLLRAKTVLINEMPTFRVDWMPFGGTESSGIGLSGVPYTFKELTDDKLIIFNKNKGV
jgi:acyl-CoA reductase-like NAD-dependent aldehyde dehydrogenase